MKYIRIKLAAIALSASLVATFNAQAASVTTSCNVKAVIKNATAVLRAAFPAAKVKVKAVSVPQSAVFQGSDIQAILLANPLNLVSALQITQPVTIQLNLSNLPAELQLPNNAIVFELPVTCPLQGKLKK